MDFKKKGIFGPKPHEATEKRLIISNKGNVASFWRENFSKILLLEWTFKRGYFLEKKPIEVTEK